MKTYSVKQVADMLNTNPETVRRWIRNKKLHAVQVSRKDGNIIAEDDLQRFLNATPKYSQSIATSLVSSIPTPALGIPLAVAALVGAKAAGYIEEKKELELKVLPSDIAKYLRDSINRHEKSIFQKKNAIKQLEMEVVQEQKEMERLMELLQNEAFEKNI